MWGDRLGQGRFGFNNDHIVFTPLGNNRALLTIHFESISGRPWHEGHAAALGGRRSPGGTGAGGGDLLIAFTSAGSEPGEGCADPVRFRGPQGETLWPGGLGFSHPDTLMVDGRGNLWLTTDRGGGREDLDVFGNNSFCLLPADPTPAGEALCFATASMESELCGPCVDQEESSLFLAVQHPGEAHGTRQGARETHRLRLIDRDGRPFLQERQVPLGSNWPAAEPGSPPGPGWWRSGGRREGRCWVPEGKPAAEGGAG